METNSIEIREEGRQDRQCFYCGTYEDSCPITLHHVFRRGSNPELISDPKNLMPLCSICHQRTETDESFYKLLQQLWNRK